MDRFNLYTHMKLLSSSILLYLPNRFIPANIPDFYSQGLFFALDRAVPELFGFLAVADDIAQLVDFDFAVRMPFALGAGAIQAKEFNQLQTFFADFNGLEGFLGI